MIEVRAATVEDADLVGRIAAEGFYADPVLSWVLQDDTTRLGLLELVMRSNALSMIDGGRVDLAGDASCALWRDPTYDHHQPDDPDGGSLADLGPFTPDELARFEILTTTMHERHPHEPHWYLNVLSTRPSHQSRGLGAAAIQPVLAQADADGAVCFLESTNPRNRTLYRRHGFVDGDELHLDGGPTMLQMWRDPRP